MNYFERLETSEPLFVQIVKEEEIMHKRQRSTRLNFLKERYGPYLYNPENLPQSSWDILILKATGVSKYLEPLKNFGSTTLLADFYEPFLDRQIAKGRLSAHEAAEGKNAILRGTINQSIKDGYIGGSIHWIGEKYLQYEFISPWSYQVMPYESAVLFNLWFFFANAGAIPYFLSRSLWELKRISQERTLSKRDIIIQTIAVSSNLIPGVSICSTPFANFNRAEGFFGAIIEERWDKIKRPFNSARKSFSFSKKPPISS